MGQPHSCGLTHIQVLPADQKNRLERLDDVFVGGLAVDMDGENFFFFYYYYYHYYHHSQPWLSGTPKKQFKWSA